jgi:hypothetical protein
MKFTMIIRFCIKFLAFLILQAIGFEYQPRTGISSPDPSPLLHSEGQQRRYGESGGWGWARVATKAGLIPTNARISIWFYCIIKFTDPT